MIEANRAGIFIDNLLYETGFDHHHCNGNGSNDSVLRVLYFEPPNKGMVMFLLNRNVEEGEFINVIIKPDDAIVHSQKFLTHTSTIFSAKSHFVAALALEGDRAIVHDDFAKKSVVSIQSFLFLSIFVSILTNAIIISVVRIVQRILHREWRNTF